jgi:hypothetical protein
MKFVSSFVGLCLIALTLADYTDPHWKTGK